MTARPDGPSKATPVLEWIAASAGAAVAIAMIGYLSWHGLTRADAPADLVIELEAIEPARGGFRIEIAVANRGGRTAAEARIEARSRGAGGVEEQREISFDHIPGQSVRRGTLIFRHPPRADSLDLRVLGYRDP